MDVPNKVFPLISMVALGCGFGVFAIGHTLMSNTGVVRSPAGDLRVGLGRSS